MPFPDSFLEELRARNDIVDVVSSYVSLRPQSGDYYGLCPFHNEKTPSFHVRPEQQIYYCFGCHKGGSVITFIMEIEHLTYPDAVRFLANRAGLTVPEDERDNGGLSRRRLLALNRDAARFYNSLLKSEEGAKARAYLEKRRIINQTATRFGLGAAPDGWFTLTNAMKQKGYTELELVQAGLAIPFKEEKKGVFDRFRDRLMFPVINVSGEVIAFGGRTLCDDKAKYMNSPETPVFSKRRALYGIHLAKNTKRGSIILCEGNIDVVTLHQAGFDNAVASMGTALTTEQTRLISRYAKEIVICYDNDPAGIQATQRALDILKNSEFAVKVLKLPDRIVDGQRVKIDADDFIKLYGPEAFEKLLQGSENHVEYSLMTLQNQFDLSSPEGKVEYLKAAGAMIARLASPVEREVYGGRAAEAAGVSRESMLQEIERSRRSVVRREKKELEREETRPTQTAQPRDRGLRYTNVRSAAAEEGVLRLLMLDPALLACCDLQENEFSSGFLGRIYGILRSRIENKQTVSAAALSGELEGEEMSQLVRITQKPEELSGAKKSLQDYITVIRTEKLKNTTDLLALANRYKETKGMEDGKSDKKG